MKDHLNHCALLFAKSIFKKLKLTNNVFSTTSTWNDDVKLLQRVWSLILSFFEDLMMQDIVLHYMRFVWWENVVIDLKYD